MVAYSFQARFAPPIIAKLKRHTLRNPRKRHAEPAETIQLYTGMRTKSCKLVGTAVCMAVLPLRLDFDERRAEFLASGHTVTTPADTDAFAVADGFQDWQDMERFWAKQHPDVRQWEGLMIQWGDTFKEP